MNQEAGELPLRPEWTLAEEDKWVEENNRRDAERIHDRASDFFTKVNEATVSSGQLAVRTTVLINGGAAISILAFVGGLVGQGKVDLKNIVGIANSLMWFASGVAASVASMGAAYFANYSIGRRAASQKQTWVHPYLEPTLRSKRWRRVAIAFQFLAASAATISLVLFILGMVHVRNAISGLN